ncbi:MAG: flagellar basal body P-ring formation protein FlgA [Rhodopirellula sp.]|nr:flagellar basal body P-ring formation protein FlgA [Rhodopirellula sp.]
MTLKQMILVFFVGCGLSASAQTSHATIVRLHSSATVDNALIHLGDVADIFSDDELTADRLQTITLSTSPIPGNSTRLQLDQIRSRLMKFDVEVGGLEFQGSSIVLVTRRGQLPASSSTAPPLASATHHQTKSQPFEKTKLASHATSHVRVISNLRDVSTSDIRLAETVIHDLVKNYLAEWAPDWGEPIIRPLLVVPTVPTILAARSGNLKIVSGKALDADIFLLSVAVPSSGSTPASTASAGESFLSASPKIVQVRVRVTRRPKVLAARRVIPQGQLVHEADLEWREVDDIRNGTSDPETVVGMEARRTIREGDFIQLNSVKPPILIQRDELVKVAVTFGSIHVTRTLKARRAGVLNDIIELVPLDGSDKTPILVRVTGKGQAEPIDRGSDGDSSIRLTVNKN